MTEVDCWDWVPENGRMSFMWSVLSHLAGRWHLHQPKYVMSVGDVARVRRTPVEGRPSSGPESKEDR